ncbi:MAG: hypothetical protein ACLFP1_00860 [Candidatus Goldiibacteriota bacterium]
MKKIFVVFVVVLFLSFVSVYAYPDEGNEKTPDNYISMNALSFLGLFFNCSYERSFGDVVGLRIGGAYWALQPSSDVVLGGGFAELYFYPEGEALRGFFMGPGVSVIEGPNYIPKASIGYRWINGNFGMDIVFGAHILATLDEVMADVMPAWPSLEFNLGYAF